MHILTKIPNVRRHWWWGLILLIHFSNFKLYKMLDSTDFYDHTKIRVLHSRELFPEREIIIKIRSFSSFKKVQRVAENQTVTSVTRCFAPKHSSKSFRPWNLIWIVYCWHSHRTIFHQEQQLRAPVPKPHKRSESRDTILSIFSRGQ